MIPTISPKKHANIQAPEEPHLLIAQMNTQKICMIHDINEAAANLFGYAQQALLGTNVLHLFAPATAKALAELLEYDADSPDFESVLAKLRNVRFIDVEGHEFEYGYRLHRSDARDANSWFSLAFPDERSGRARQQLLDFIRHHLEGQQVLDGVTGLPDYASCARLYGSLENFIRANDIQAALAIVRIDRFEKSVLRYGAEACGELLNHVASGCKRTLDAGDVICALNGRDIAIFMLNVSRDSARVMLNRLRWLIRSHRIYFGGKEDFSVTVSVVFDMIQPESDHNILKRCEEAVETIAEEDRNRLLEIAP